MNILNIILEKSQSRWELMVLKGGIIFSTVLTAFLTSIGYPKQVITFILVLMMADIVTRWMAEIIKAYRSFSIGNFFHGWKEKILNSKKLKAGLFLKVIFYSIFLFIAHQASIAQELVFGQIISTFLYSILIVLDSISICENAIDAGFDNFKPVLAFFKKKQENLLVNDYEIEAKKDSLKDDSNLSI